MRKDAMIRFRGSQLPESKCNPLAGRVLDGAPVHLSQEGVSDPREWEREPDFTATMSILLGPPPPTHHHWPVDHTAC